jgi:hypothetical protein
MRFKEYYKDYTEFEINESTNLDDKEWVKKSHDFWSEQKKKQPKDKKVGWNYQTIKGAAKQHGLVKESAFETKNIENKQLEDIDELKQTISKMFNEGMKIDEIEAKLQIRIIFPMSVVGAGTIEPPNKYDDEITKNLISKTYEIVKM